MTKNLRCWCWQLGLASLSAIAGASIPDSRNCALAQSKIVPDTTLGAESSVVIPTNNNGLPIKRIDGGAHRGANLFHSFDVFSIPTGSAAHFNNALNIQNIISRVTGGEVSNIDGLLGANGIANLFLLNPNGIIFGPNASLNIGGSFVGSTASSLNFADSKQFSATAPQTTPLLTVSVPIGLQFGGNPGRILVKGDGQGLRATSELIDTTVGLRVQPSQTLALVGGDVLLTGGTLKTAGGRIELSSVAAPGLVSLTPIDSGWALGYSGITSFGNIQLSGQATADASGAGGGDVQVWGRRVTLQDGSQIEASTLGGEPGGALTVTALESVEAIGTTADGRQFPSALFAQVYPGAIGAGGNLIIETGRLIVRDGAQISAATFGAGSAGTLAVSARESVELIGKTSGLFTSVQPEATGAGGNLTVQTERLILRDRARIEASTSAKGNGGNLVIATEQLIVRDGSQILATTFNTGSAGNLEVKASESVELIGFFLTNAELSSGLSTSVDRGATGAGGKLTVETGKLIVRDGAQVSAATLGSGAAGTLEVNASDSVEVSGTSAKGKFPSGLVVESNATGNGGNLIIETGQLIVRDGAQVSAATLGSGAAGTLEVNASDSVEVSGTSADGKLPSKLTAQTTGTGNAGNLSIETEQLNVRDGAEVSVSSTRSRNAGNLQLTVRGLLLDNRGAITATTRSGNGGDIHLQAQDLLLMRRESNISTTAGTAQAGGDGGNITINTDNLVALEDSDITANAFQGRGGRVEITAQGIFGTEARVQQTLETSDITATGGSPELSGTVEINTPDVDPSQGLAELPAELVEASGLITQGCAAAGENEFIITGRGGLPPDPTKPLDSDAIWVGSLTLNPKVENRSSPPVSTNPTNPAPAQIVEAQGWVINDKGEVVLTAQAPNATPNIPWLPPDDCHAPKNSS